MSNNKELGTTRIEYILTRKYAIEFEKPISIECADGYNAPEIVGGGKELSADETFTYFDEKGRKINPR